MQQRLTVDELVARRGQPVHSSSGEKLGNIETVFYDPASGEAEWIRVESGGLFSSSYAIVPATGAQVGAAGNGGVMVPYSKDQVKDAPDVAGDEISEEQERELYAYYGLQPSEAYSETQLPTGQVEPTGMRGTDVGMSETTDVGTRETAAGARPGESVEMSRYEEQMRVGKRDIPRRVRLRKWVETAPVSEQVDLRRETAHIEREQVDRPAPGARIGEEESVETTLHDEEAVVSKETVERERVRLETDEEVREETVQGEVRREHIEVEGDAEDEDRDEGLRRAG